MTQSNWLYSPSGIALIDINSFVLIDFVHITGENLALILIRLHWHVHYCKHWTRLANVDVCFPFCPNYSHFNPKKMNQIWNWFRIVKALISFCLFRFSWVKKAAVTNFVFPHVHVFETWIYVQLRNSNISFVAKFQFPVFEQEYQNSKCTLYNQWKI